MMRLIALVATSILFVSNPEFSAPPQAMPDMTRESIEGTLEFTVTDDSAWETILGKAVLEHQICERVLQCTFRVTYEYHFFYAAEDAAKPTTVVGRYLMWRNGRVVESFAYGEFGNEPYHYLIRHEDQWDELAPKTPEWTIEDHFYKQLIKFLDQQKSAPEPTSKPTPTRPKQEAGRFYSDMLPFIHADDA